VLKERNELRFSVTRRTRFAATTIRIQNPTIRHIRHTLMKARRQKYKQFPLGCHLLNTRTTNQ